MVTELLNDTLARLRLVPIHYVFNVAQRSLSGCMESIKYLFHDAMRSYRWYFFSIVNLLFEKTMISQSLLERRNTELPSDPSRKTGNTLDVRCELD